MPRHVFATGYGKPPGWFDTTDAAGRWVGRGWLSRPYVAPHREVLYLTARGDWIDGWEYQRHLLSGKSATEEQSFRRISVSRAAEWFRDQRIEPPDSLTLALDPAAPTAGRIDRPDRTPPAAPGTEAPVSPSPEPAETPAPVPKRKPPSDKAVQCYRLIVIRGDQRTQESIGKEIYGKAGQQSRVSRNKTAVEEWLANGNVLPDLEEPKPRTIPVDPRKLDMGPRQDTGRRPRE